MTRYRAATVLGGCMVMAALGQFGAPVASAEDARESAGTQVAYTVGSTLLTIVHIPLKAALCGTAAVMGGLTYLLTVGNPPVARDASDTVQGVCTGPYIITPERLRAAGDAHGSE